MTDLKPSQYSISKQTTDVRLNEAYHYLLNLFKQLGYGVYYLCAYRCAEALQVFASLPQAHKETPWTFSKIGRVYFEMAKYIDVSTKIYYRGLLKSTGRESF
jgi:anaphase-promoting complex subunit 3